MARRYSRRLRIIAVAAGTVAVLIGAVVVGGAMILDMSAVTAQIQAQVSRSIDGKVAWDTLRVRVLPVPRAILRGMDIEIPGNAHARIEEVSVYLRPWPLLHGNAEIRSITLLRPAVRIDVPASTSPQTADTREPISVYRSAMTSAVQAMR